MYIYELDHTTKDAVETRDTPQEECYNNTINLDIDKPIKTCELPLTLTVDDIANALNISKQNAYFLCHKKSFPCVQIGKRLVIPRAAFEKWLENPFIFESEDN
jgi:excisionase family DNA binding protein